MLRPNVSHCVDDNEVHYNPKAVMTVVYNVLSTDPTNLYFCQNYDGAVFNGAAMFDSVEIDGVEVSIADLDSASGRTLFSVGEHTVRYTLKDPTFIGIERDEQTGRPTRIGACFIGCYYITSVIIPTTVTIIGIDVFYGCGLTNVTIPNGVTSIGDYAFQDCTDLTSVTIPNSVTSIGESAFSNSKLTNVTIPNGVTTIGAEAFMGCFSLTSITIPNSVTSIGYCAFMDAGLVSITIPSSVTYVGEDALACGNLVRATVYSNAALNGHFKNLPLEEVVLGDNITTIGDYTFQNCTNLSGITIPNSVTSIGEYAFNNCWFNSITIPDSVTNIGEYAFYESSISDVVIGDGVTEIKRDTFGRCYGIENVTLGSGITRIGENAFSDASTGDKLICKAITPPTVDTGNQLDGFYGGIFVPAESVNAYKSASGWSYVANKIQAIPTT